VTRWRGICAALAVSATLHLAAAGAPGPGRPPARFLLQWGNQGSGPGEFHFPIGIALDRRGRVFVTDHYNNRVEAFDSWGRLLDEFPVLPNPGGIAVGPDGNLYLTHFSSSRLDPVAHPDQVSVYAPHGRLLRRWGSTGKGDGQLDCGGGVAVASDGRVYIADQTNRRVQVFSPEGRFLYKWGEYGTAPGQFGGDTSPRSRVGGPQFLALDAAGCVYSTEAGLCRVQKFTPEGRFLLAWSDPGEAAGGMGGAFQGTRLHGPTGICLDARGNLWVAVVGGRVLQYSPGGRLLRVIGGAQGSAAGELRAPHGVAVDSRGDLYVVDAYNHRIQKFAVPTS
jgi:DNA-binding beta-propeller fold protein YncE